MTPVESSAIELAAQAATEAHRHQTRKDKMTPYIVHPARVAALVRHYGGSPDAVIAAWLHDVVEDCGEPGQAAVAQAIGAMRLPADRKIRIADMVAALTKDSGIRDKEQRLDDTLRRVLTVHPEATLVKLCDRIDNLIDARDRDAAFRQRYDSSSGRLAAMLKDRAREFGYTGALELIEKMRGCPREGKAGDR